MDLKISIGEAARPTEAASKPLAAYVMKQRIVRVNLYLVTKTGNGQPDNAPDLANTAPEESPVGERLAAYLTSVFRLRINAGFTANTTAMSRNGGANKNG